MIIAVDPGNEQSAYLIWGKNKVEGMGIVSNYDLKAMLKNANKKEYILVIEMIASYGMPVGETIFETCLWIGKFLEMWDREIFSKSKLVYRKDIKLHLCGTARAKDSNIRQALIDKFGGREKAIGKKANPGILYGIKKDLWQALAVAIFYSETKK